MTDHVGGNMAINFVRILDGSDDSIRFQPMERLNVYLFGATVCIVGRGIALFAMGLDICHRELSLRHRPC